MTDLILEESRRLQVWRSTLLLEKLDLLLGSPLLAGVPAAADLSMPARSN